MLAIQSEKNISLITDLKLYQDGNKYAIQYNNSNYYGVYDTKEEAKKDFKELSYYIQESKLTILNEKINYEIEIQEKEK